MKYDGAIIEAKANPQAYACMGITIAGGLSGVFCAVFLEETLLRWILGSAGLLFFMMGMIGHSHFKKRERMASYKPSMSVRRAIAITFAAFAVGSLFLGAFAVAHGDFLILILAVGFAVGIFPLVRALLSPDE